ncbi:hypothetical protein BU15DRAFT_83064 [Melanogaster broomeanus]|nr:hypothetical protein BU15DRAFT_83064 [Melanogaster broomeanus]
MFFRSALLFAGAGIAAAQSLSSQCNSALLSFAGSSDSTCLNPSALVQLALSSSSSSIIPTAAVTNITAGCSAELQSLGQTSDPATLTTAVQEVYPTFRQVVCLKDTGVGSLCVTELLTGIQTATTTLTLTNFVNLITQAMSGQNVGIPQNVECSSCSKAMYTTAAAGLPSLVSSEQSAVESTCGTSFTDGQMPSGIQETASNSTTTTTGGAAALSVSSLNIGAAMLVAVSSAFAIFA